MKVCNMRARICAVLFISLFSSTTFAATTTVPDRASLGGTDFIDWQSLDNGDGDFTWVVGPIVTPTDGGATVTVTQQLFLYPDYHLILRQPSPHIPGTNFATGDYLYSTNYDSDTASELNPIIFSNFAGPDICGFGTQIAPKEAGGFKARIESFDTNGDMGFVEVDGTTPDGDAAFIGISSTVPMNRVEISILSTGDDGGISPGFYAINRVDLKACESGPDVPKLTCDGFFAPMDRFPVKTKKNRAFPLKMKLFDADGFEQTDVDLLKAPVVTVLFEGLEASDEDEPVDVSGDILSSGKGSEGNQFVFTDEGIWQFNLKSNNYSAEGTYWVTVSSGDETEYVIDPACMTSFVK